MFSVFSNYLTPVTGELNALTEQSKPSEIYTQLRNTYNQGVVGILNSTRLIAPISNDEDNYDIIEEIWRNKDLQKIVQWINQKITLSIGIATYQTLLVRIRIATSMMNKLVAEGKLNHKFNIRIHNYLVKNVWNEVILITNEELPF